MNRRIVGWTLFLLALECGAEMLLWSHLPARVPTHWNAAGVVNGWSSRMTLLVMGPVILAALGGLYATLKKLLPQCDESEESQGRTERAEVYILLFLAYVHGVMLWAATGQAIDAGHAIVYGICLLLALLSNVPYSLLYSKWLEARGEL